MLKFSMSWRSTRLEGASQVTIQLWLYSKLHPANAQSWQGEANPRQHQTELGLPGTSLNGSEYWSVSSWEQESLGVLKALHWYFLLHSLFSSK